MTNNFCNLHWGFRKDISWVRIAIFWGLIGCLQAALFPPVTLIKVYARWRLKQKTPCNYNDCFLNGCGLHDHDWNDNTHKMP
jgi:hypothetical protein